MRLCDWYRVHLDDAGVHLDVFPPEGDAWQAEIRWEDIMRVCFKAEDFLQSDGWYLFTKERPESYAIPVDANGGEALLDALLQRGLFDAGLAIGAASPSDEIFCWPPAGN